jgi:protein SCO1/2
MTHRRFLLTGAGAASLAGLGATLVARLPQAPVTAHGPGAIPNVLLTTHTGRTVRFYDDVVRDRLVVINMMYAGCNDTCPPATFNLVKVQQLLGDRVGTDIFMYSITLRPDQDSPADLAHYARMHQVQPGWLFLAASRSDTEQLRYALGYYDPDPAVDRIEGRHVGMVRIGNDPYQRWGMAPALADPRQIVSAILHLDRQPPPDGSRVRPS